MDSNGDAHIEAGLNGHQHLNGSAKHVRTITSSHLD